MNDTVYLVGDKFFIEGTLVSPQLVKGVDGIEYLVENRTLLDDIDEAIELFYETNKSGY